MHLLRTSLAAVALIGGVTVATAQAPQSVSTTAAAGRAMAGKQLSPADSRDWKSIRSPVLSNDGHWFAYILAPNEGDANVVVRSTGDAGKELRFPIGEIPAPPTNPFSGGATTTALAISGDSKWVAFSIYPSQRDARRLRQQHRPSQNRVALVNVVTGQKTEFDKIRRFAFAGDKPQWIALYGYAPEALGTAQGGTPNGNIGGSGNGVASPTPRSESADLLLVALGDGAVINIGNVGDFGFDDSGAFLAYTIDARDQIGNGVQLRDLRTDVVRVLDSEPALYRRLTWSDSGPALTVLRGKADSAAKDTVYSVLAFSGIGTVSQKKTIFDAAGRADFPTGMRVSGDRAPRISEDFATVFFGIQQAKPKAAEPAMASRDGNAGSARQAVVQAGAPGEGGTRNQPRVNADDENPSLVLWHWKDPRLQSMQLVQEQQDKSFSYLGEYRLAENRFVRLADESLRSVTLLPHERYAYGVDTRDYDQRASYDGRQYADVYLLDLKSGERKIASKKSLSFFSMPSPDGRELLYWGDDAHYYVLDAATGQKRNVTKDVAVSFANLEDDHNNIVAPPRRPFGWAKDASAVLLYDGWDVWKVPVRSGGKAVNLTIDGRKTQVHYQRLYAFEAPGSGGRRGRGSVAAGPGAAAVSDGVDLSKPLYFATYSEWTKKEGFARVDVSRPGATTLVADDASLNFLKAKDADLFVYTRQTSTDFPNYYIASADFKRGRPITDANPQQKNFLWSKGTRPLDHVRERQGRHASGCIVSAGELRAGAEIPLARHDLREAFTTAQHVRESERDEYAEPEHLHEPRLRRARSRHRLSSERSRNVGCLVRAPGRAGGDRDGDHRLGAHRPLGSLVGGLSDGVPRHPDEHVPRCGGRCSAHRHGEHVQLSLLEHRWREPGDLRVEPRAVQGELHPELRRLHPELAGLPRRQSDDAARDPA